MLKSGLDTKKTSASGVFFPVNLFFVVDKTAFEQPFIVCLPKVASGFGIKDTLQETKGATLFCACLQNPLDHSSGYALTWVSLTFIKKGHAQKLMKLIGLEPRVLYCEIEEKS